MKRSSPSARDIHERVLQQIAGAPDPFAQER